MENQQSIGQESSRKTSTASECTTMSDYTPENTISSSTNSSPPTISVERLTEIQNEIGLNQQAQPDPIPKGI